MRTSVILIALLAGCATQPTYEWRHATHNDRTRFDRDFAQCEYESAAATGSYTPDNRGYRTGLGHAIADQLDMNRRQTEIGTLCMKARGYSQHPISEPSLPPTPVANVPAVAPQSPPPALVVTPPVVVRKGFDISKVDQLQPGISTISDAIELLGKPNAESSFSNNTKLLQWHYIQVPTVTRAGILFDAAGKMIRVTSKYSSNN